MGKVHHEFSLTPILTCPLICLPLTQFSCEFTADEALIHKAITHVSGDTDHRLLRVGRDENIAHRLPRGNPAH